MEDLNNVMLKGYLQAEAIDLSDDQMKKCKLFLQVLRGKSIDSTTIKSPVFEVMCYGKAAEYWLATTCKGLHVSVVGQLEKWPSGDVHISAVHITEIKGVKNDI